MPAESTAAASDALSRDVAHTIIMHPLCAASSAVFSPVKTPTQPTFFSDCTEIICGKLLYSFDSYIILKMFLKVWI